MSSFNKIPLEQRQAEVRAAWQEHKGDWKALRAQKAQASKERRRCQATTTFVDEGGLFGEAECNREYDIVLTSLDDKRVCARCALRIVREVLDQV